MVHNSMLRAHAENSIFQFTRDKLALRYELEYINTVFSNSQLYFWKNTWQLKKDKMVNYEFNLFVNNEYYEIIVNNYQEINQLLFEGLYTVDTSFLEGPVLTTRIYPSSNIYNTDINFNNNSTYNKNITNQGIIGDTEQITYNTLNFKSQSEIKIAQELDCKGILYFPLPAASFGGIIKEPDFMIQHPITGQWGVLEVNGPHHTNSAKDHQRSRLFFERGLLCQFYTAEESYNNPSYVVENFLTILEKF